MKALLRQGCMLFFENENGAMAPMKCKTNNLFSMIRVPMQPSAYGVCIDNVLITPELSHIFL